MSNKTAIENTFQRAAFSRTKEEIFFEHTCPSKENYVYFCSGDYAPSPLITILFLIYYY